MAVIEGRHCQLAVATISVSAARLRRDNRVGIPAKKLSPHAPSGHDVLGYNFDSF